jgi:NifB/MoaA-like Fe-S oxidoreductase
LATAELPAGFIQREILPGLQRISNLEVTVEVVPNVLFGRSVTVAGLLTGKCLYSALRGKDCGDLLLLPPDILNADGLFLDDTTIAQLEKELKTHVFVYDGSWADVFKSLQQTREF